MLNVRIEIEIDVENEVVQSLAIDHMHIVGMFILLKLVQRIIFILHTTTFQYFDIDLIAINFVVKSNYNY